jgi:hypothetical protein
MSNTRRIVGLGVALAVSVSWASAARAAGSADEAAGLALFEEGKRLAAGTQWDQACPKFAEANRLFPRAGILLVLGDCYEHANHLASAWGSFKAAEVLARGANDAARQQEAVRRASALEPGLSKVTIVAPPNSPAGVSILWDGVTVGEGRWGTPTPVDAGVHRVEVTAPGWQPWSTTVQVPLAPGNTDVRIPQLAAEPGGANGSGASGSGQRTLGIALGGAGIVGLVVGAVSGAVAISRSNTSKANCSPTDPNFCNAAGVSARQGEQSAGTVSTVAFVAGGAFLAAGAVLVLTAPSGRTAEAVKVGLVPWAPGADAGLAILGRW